MALLGGQVAAGEEYPNFLSTIYWNPMVDIPAGEVFEFKCILPQYKGKFRIVVEGITDSMEEVYFSRLLE